MFRVAGKSTFMLLVVLVLVLTAAEEVVTLYRLLASIEPYPWGITSEWLKLAATAGVLLGVAMLHAAAVAARRANERLAQSEAQLRLLTDALPVAISYVDREQRYRFNNAAFESLFGSPRLAVTGRVLRDVIPPGEYLQVEPFLRSAMAGQPVQFKLRVGVHGRGLRTFDVQYVPDADSDGTVRGIYIVSSDITRHEESERALFEATEKYRTVVENIREGMFIAQDYRIVFANPALHTLLGYAPGELMGKPFEELVAPRDYPIWRERFAQRIAGLSPPSEYEAAMLRRSGGGRVYIELRATLSQYEGAAAVLGTVIDVSTRHAHEQELKEHEERLRNLEAELTHAQRLSAVGETAASLAHELNQPLNAIVSYMEGAKLRFQREVSANPALGEVLSETARVARRASEVVRSVRNLARKGEAGFAPVDVNEAACEVLRLLDAEIIRRGVRVDTALADPLPRISGNYVQIEQLLVNLLGNGMEAMDTSREVMPRIALATGVTNGGDVEIRVRDSGPGIAEQARERLFSPFFTTKSKGLGMGLAVCRSIVERHGGRIWAESGDGPGAEFRVVLPALKERMNDAP